MAEFYAIVLDRYRERYPDHWPVSGRFSSHEKAKQRTYYKGNPTRLARSGYKAHYCSETSVRNAKSPRAKAENAYIYKLRSKGSA